jgi:Protein of unknown function (DUF4238)
MNHPRDHHFIPIFYLKKWVGPNGKLIEYSRPYPNKFAVKAVGPRGTGFQKDLYNFPNCRPEIAHHLEAQFLMQTDNDAAKALEKHLSGNNGTWTSQERSAWSRFINNFRIRHPDPFEEIKASVNFNWLQGDAATQQQYEVLRQPDFPPTFEGWVRAQGNNLEDRMIVRLLQVVLDNEPAGTRVNHMLWNVLDLSASRFKLLTSDWPVVRRFYGEVILLMLPISPTKLFIAVTHRPMFERVRKQSTNDLVRLVNVDVVSKARRFVYSQDHQQDRFILNRMSTSMETPPFYPSLARAANH